MNSQRTVAVVTTLGVLTLAAAVLAAPAVLAGPTAQVAPTAPVAQVTAPGWLDPTYGSSGLAGEQSGPVLTLLGRTVDSSGRALVATTTVDGSEWSSSLTRLTPDGQLDPTFAGGVVPLIFDAITQFDPIALYADAGGAVTVGGRGDHGGVSAVARYTNGGLLDPSFGSDGLAFVLGITDIEDRTQVVFVPGHGLRSAGAGW